MKYDEIIREFARRQEMLMSRRQLLAAGVYGRAIKARVSSGMLEPISDQVLRLAGATASPVQPLLAAVLEVGEGAYISHTTAAYWWGFAGFRLDRVHVSIERVYHWRQPDHGFTVHHSTVIPDWCQKVHRNVPVVSPGFTLFQLAGSIAPDRVARAADSAWSLGLINGRLFDELLLRLGRSGRNGIVLMRKIRRDRPGEWTPPASNLESRFDEIMAPYGIRFRRQVDIGDENWSGRVDFLADDCPFIVEVMSERYHTSLTDQRADAERRDRHQRMGFVVVEVWDFEIFSRPWVVVQRVTKAHREALASRSRDQIGTLDVSIW